MIASIMQPYFFPYIGYFQLIYTSDVFIAYDDVQYIKGGWINRNRILTENGPAWMTLPVVHANHKSHIRERYYADHPVKIAKCLQRIAAAYRKAPMFPQVFSFLCDITSHRDPNIAAFNVHMLRRLSKRLGINTPIRLSSELKTKPDLCGEDRVIDICRNLGATDYVNPIGGVGLYDARRFAQSGIKLKFLKPTLEAYPQFKSPPVSSLSIVDVMMFNDDAAIRRMLAAFELA